MIIAKKVARRPIVACSPVDIESLRWTRLNYMAGAAMLSCPLPSRV